DGTAARHLGPVDCRRPAPRRLDQDRTGDGAAAPSPPPRADRDRPRRSDRGDDRGRDAPHRAGRLLCRAERGRTRWGDGNGRGLGAGSIHAGPGGVPQSGTL
ncbi:MAG: hypothetical protein AVDCRST_MAG59-4708, partial [uncultured Thermomicrobiales bacterium]